mgnify:CR=1 FL=1
MIIGEYELSLISEIYYFDRFEIPEGIKIEMKFTVKKS